MSQVSRRFLEQGCGKAERTKSAEAPERELVVGVLIGGTQAIRENSSL